MEQDILVLESGPACLDGHCSSPDVTLSPLELASERLPCAQFRDVTCDGKVLTQNGFIVYLERQVVDFVLRATI